MCNVRGVNNVFSYNPKAPTVACANIDLTICSSPAADTSVTVPAAAEEFVSKNLFSVIIGIKYLNLN